MRRVLTAALAALAVLGCAEPRSFLVVVVDADPGLAASSDAIEVIVRGPTEERPPERIELGESRLPYTIGLEAAGGLEPVVIEARALDGATVQVTRRVRTGFVRGEVRAVIVRLEAACAGELCTDSTTCIGGSCVSDAIPAAELPPWNGPIESDAGVMMDAGLPDATTPIDAAIDAPSDAGTDAAPFDAGPPPPLVPIPSPIAAGHDHSCALKGETLWCWGSSDEGQAGGATGPTPVAFDLTRVAGVCAGMRFTCAWTLDGEAWCAGRMEGASGPVFRSASKRRFGNPAGTRVRGMACGHEHACALLDDGRVACAGRGTEGQLGDGSSTDAPLETPEIARLDDDAQRLAAGEQHSCAHLADGRMACWGWNSLSRGGAPVDFEELATPRVVDAMPVELEGATRMAGGGGHTCAIAGGQLYCWGANTHGERGCLGTAPRAVATPVPGATSGVAELALGLDHTCFVMNGTVSCIGHDDYGQTGRAPGSAGDDCAVSGVSGIGGETATHVAAGRFHACARMSTGSIACWGLNERGQCGDISANGPTVRRVTLP